MNLTKRQMKVLAAVNKAGSSVSSRDAPIKQILSNLCSLKLLKPRVFLDQHLHMQVGYTLSKAGREILAEAKPKSKETR